MKKIFLIALLIVSYVGAFAQAEVYRQMENPSGNTLVTPDTTRNTGAYYFESPKMNNVKSIIIQCITKKDSGTVAGNIHIQGSIDLTSGTGRTWNTLVGAAGDSLLMTDGDNSRSWVYEVHNANPLQKPEYYNYRAVLNLTAKSRSRVKCFIKSKQH